MTEVRVERVLEAPIGTLWAYLSTARGLSTWHADEVRGDLQKGEFQARYPSLGAELTLRTEDVRPGESLTFKAGPSRVAVSLEQLSATETRVRIVHRGLDDDDDLPGFRASWALALALLDLAACRHENRERSVTWLFAQAKAPAELVHYYFSSAQGLNQWLGKSDGDIGLEGSRVKIRVSDSFTITGTVLCHEPGRDLCLRWHEEGDAGLILRTLPGGPEERQLALSVSSFGRKLDAKTESVLKGALKRLQERLRVMGRG